MKVIEKKDLANFNEDILNTIRESLLVLDSELRVIYANKSFYKQFSVKKRDTENKLVYELGNGQWNIPKLRKLLQEILPQKKFFNGYEMEHNFPIIGRKIMLINARRIEDKFADYTLMLMAIEDVTKEKNLIEYATQENKLSAVGLLVAGVAHGLNSPLTGILNFLEVYSNQETVGSQKQKELKLMIEAAKFMSQTIYNLTQFVGGTDAVFGKIDLADVIDSMLILSERQLLTNKIRVVKEYAKESEFIVNGNRSQLQHAFLNLLINSRDAINRDGKITIRLINSANDKDIILEIEDTGIGIIKKNIPKIFTPFFSTKKANGGVGLGLSTTQGIIFSHNGKIRVESERGRGAKFIINLPKIK